MQRRELRISVRRVNDVAFVEHVDHVVTDDQYSAFNKVIQAQVDGRHISWDDALRQAAGDRVRLLPDHHHPNGRSDVDG